MHVTRLIKCRQKQREKQGDDHSSQNAPKYQNNQTIQHNTIRAKIPFLLKIIRELCRIQSENWAGRFYFSHNLRGQQLSQRFTIYFISISIMEYDTIH